MRGGVAKAGKSFSLRLIACPSHTQTHTQTHTHTPMSTPDLEWSGGKRNVAPMPKTAPTPRSPPSIASLIPR